VITGPHASAAFPKEMLPFVDPRFTKRLQFDFTDVSASPVARRWCESTAACCTSRTRTREPFATRTGRSPPTCSAASAKRSAAVASAGLCQRAGIGVLAATCVSTLVVNANTSAVTILLPALADDVGGSVDTLQWAVTGYSLVGAACIVTSGALGDVSAPRPARSSVGSSWNRPDGKDCSGSTPRSPRAASR
jgi:hypothetical protein